MRMIRPLVLVLTLLSLTVTGVGGAWARGQAPAVGTVELCLGLSAVTVSVDASGQPVAPPHLCGEKALSLILALAAPAPKGLWRPLEAVVHVAPAEQRAAGFGPWTSRARGPPPAL